MNPILDCLRTTVARFPERIAVADAKRSYSFRALWHEAACLAARIAQRGRGIGVLVERGAETAVLFLAVTLSGNYYIPFDPALPPQKRQAILADASLTLMLGSEEGRALFAGEAVSYLTLADAAAQECAIPEAGVDTPLYMVYTSGSTGKPKGVLKSHGAMLSFLSAYTARFGFSEQEVIGNQTPFFFDASAKDYYLMFCTGARLEILPSELFSFPVRLVAYMNERGVTFISWVPTALCIVTQLNTFQELLPTTLRRVFFIGEVFPRKQLDAWRRALPELEYVNLYGSSELAGACCCYPVPDELPDGTALPIGKPLENCHILLMDGQTPVTRPGQIGELYVASPALALGYYHDAQRTAASFFALTFPDGVTRRTFRTGDMASYNENGDLVFAARRDYQIKHMGRRIELGEIEAAADTLPQLRRCCCLYHAEKKRITLFCELAADCNWDGRQVRSALKGLLTDYMLPARVVVLDALPLNANGKIDRQSLQASMN